MNSHRTTAIVVRKNGDKVTLVPMCSGRLAAKTISFAEFLSEWRETTYPLEKALATFMCHAQAKGATLEATRGFQRLVTRDRWVVANLF